MFARTLDYSKDQESRVEFDAQSSVQPISHPPYLQQTKHDPTASPTLDSTIHPQNPLPSFHLSGQSHIITKPSSPISPPFSTRRTLTAKEAQIPTTTTPDSRCPADCSQHFIPITIQYNTAPVDRVMKKCRPGGGGLMKWVKCEVLEMLALDVVAGLKTDRG